MIRAAVLFAFALIACQRPAPAPFQAKGPAPASCGGSCSSSVECRSAFDDCRSCFNGHCSGTLPADPKDAGIDAAPSGTTP